MQKLFLIRHAKPIINPKQNAKDWQLQPNQKELKTIAKQLEQQNIKRIITSHEAKAIETGRVIAQHLKLPLEQKDDLHEHNRAGAAFLDANVFQETIKKLFQFPDKLIYGRETANEALERFDRAIHDLLLNSNDDCVVVSHGTVMSLFVARYNTIDVLAFWQSLSMPDLFTLSLPEFGLLTEAE